MEKTKFTAGPWEVAPNIPTLVVPHEGDRSICTTGNWQDNLRATQVDEENEANAKLIAASPELYEALKELLSHAPSIEDLGGDESAFMNSFGVAIAKAKSALLKAGGE